MYGRPRPTTLTTAASTATTTKTSLTSSFTTENQMINKKETTVTLKVVSANIKIIERGGKNRKKESEINYVFISSFFLVGFEWSNEQNSD
jgi:hypothetical protein